MSSEDVELATKKERRDAIPYQTHIKMFKLQWQDTLGTYTTAGEGEGARAERPRRSRPACSSSMAVISSRSRCASASSIEYSYSSFIRNSDHCERGERVWLSTQWLGSRAVQESLARLSPLDPPPSFFSNGCVESSSVEHNVPLCNS